MKKYIFQIALNVLTGLAFAVTVAFFTVYSTHAVWLRVNNSFVYQPTGNYGSGQSATFIDQTEKWIIIETRIGPLLDQFRVKNEITYASIAKKTARYTQSEKKQLALIAFHLSVIIRSVSDLEPGLVINSEEVPQRLLDLLLVYQLMEYQSGCLFEFEGFPMLHLV